MKMIKEKERERVDCSQRKIEREKWKKAHEFRFGRIFSLDPDKGSLKARIQKPRSVSVILAIDILKNHFIKRKF